MVAFNVVSSFDRSLLYKGLKMSKNYPTNSDDVIDSRDIIARIEELETDIEAAVEDKEEHLDMSDEKEELVILKALVEQCEGYGDWQYGATLIRDSYFEQYAKELAEDIGHIQSDCVWPCTCIAWTKAAEELQMDYTSIDFDGVEYWMRA